MIPVGGVAILCDLRYIEAKLGANVSFGIIGVGYFVAELLSQLGKLDRHCPIHGGMSEVVSRVVRQGA